MAFAFNPFADGFAQDPYPHYAALLENAPVHEHPLGFWLVARHEDVARLQRAPGHSVDERYLTRLPAWKSDSRELGKRNRMMAGLSMLDQDPPNHTRLRRLVGQAFTRGAVDALEPLAEKLVTEALDRIADAGRADLVEQLAFPLPFTVISTMLGVPVLEHTRLRELVATLVLGLEPLSDPALQTRIRAANAELLGMVGELIDHKRTHRGNDLLTALLAAEHDGDVLSADELAAQVMLLYIAGHETSVNHLGNAILALLRHPAQLAWLRANPGRITAAVDELLRYDTPVHLMRRITREPFAAAGTEIPPGSFVLACLGAANRDPSFWGPDANELRLDRANSHQHLSFGAGMHHCLGAPLIRLESRIALARFAQRFPNPALVDLRWNGRINVRGLESLVIDV